MKNSNEMSHAICDNCGGHIDRDCNSVTVEINQVSFEFCSVTLVSQRAQDHCSVKNKSRENRISPRLAIQ